MDIRVIKLVSGEEIFGVVEEVDEEQGTILIDNPRVPMQTQQGINMLPWPMVSKQSKIEVGMHNVMLVVHPVDQLAELYQEAVTGIVKASANTLDKNGKIII